MALTLGAIVIIGTMIAGVFYLATQQQRMGRASLMQERAFRYAEAGLASAVTTWQNTNALALSVGGSLPPTVVNLPNVPTANDPTVTVTRVNSQLFQIVSQASAGSGGTSVESVRRVSQLVRIVGPTFNILGALTVRGNTQIGGASMINGNNMSPAGWSCGTTSTAPAKPGIAIGDTTMVNTSGCTSLSCVQGSPKLSQTSSATQDSTYFKFGDYTWAELVAMKSFTAPSGTANLQPEPIVASGACVTSNMSNWGDVRRLVPAGACEGYFPIIYFAGNAKLTGGSGQGIMLVEGDLEVQGGFTFYGPVIVRGKLQTAGQGGHFNGAVMAANVQLAQNSVLGSAIVNYSSCAVETAIQNAGRAKTVRQRAWAEMY